MNISIPKISTCSKNIILLVICFYFTKFFKHVYHIFIRYESF